MSITFSAILRNRRNFTWLAGMVGVALFLSYQLLFQRRGNQVKDSLYLHEPPATHLPKFVNSGASPPRENASVGIGPHKRPSFASTDHRIDCKIVRHMKKEKIVVIMRTGSTETYTKLPIHFLTTFRCFEKDDLLIYSDMDDTMGEFKITDILARVPEDFRNRNHDFGVYKDMKEYQATGQEMSTYPLEMVDREHNTAWALDKYKFLPMLEDAYFARPEGKWYIFIETDTYPIWSNILRYIRSLDPQKHLYMGSASTLQGKVFGHGGAGIILSREALARLFEGQERGYASRWGELTLDQCCGDYMVALALKDVGVSFRNLRPMLNSESPATIPFGDDHWCQAAMTIHHVPPPQMNHVWNFEQERGHDTPLQIKDLYFKFVEPRLRERPVARSWDNLSADIVYRPPGTKDAKTTKWLKNDREREAHADVAKCEEACKSQSNCLQFVWKSGANGESVRADALEEKEGQSNLKMDTIEKKIESDMGMGYPKIKEPAEPGPPLAKRSLDDASRQPSCSLGFKIQLGRYVPGKNNRFAGPGAELWISGWNMERIEQWVEKHQCEPYWVTL